MDIKRLERLAAKFLIAMSYNVSKVFPVRNKVTFATFRTTNLTGNFKFIHDEIVDRQLGVTFNYMFKKFKPSILGKFDYLIHMVLAGYHMATSKFFIIDDYYFPVYVIKPRKSNKIIQVWHACGAFKRFGYDVLDKDYGASESYISDINIHSNYDVVTVSSKEVAKHYATAFDMSEDNIFPTGIPRTDIFFSKEKIDEARARVYERFPELVNKKIVLYAPTFRGKGQTDVSFDMTVDLNRIDESMDDSTVFALKMHPFVKTRLKNTMNNVIDLSDYEDINDLLMVADMLITDYSSVIFEFSLMEKPIIMYAPDKDDYVRERDFYYEYNSFVPGPIVASTDEIISLITCKSFDLSKVKAFKYKFFDYHDGKSTERFVSNFIEKYL